MAGRWCQNYAILGHLALRESFQLLSYGRPLVSKSDTSASLATACYANDSAPVLWQAVSVKRWQSFATECYVKGFSACPMASRWGQYLTSLAAECYKHRWGTGR